MDINKYNNLSDFELIKVHNDLMLCYKGICESCGERIDIKMQIYTWSEENLDKEIKNIRKRKLCLNCISKNTWQIILKTYKVAYKNDKYKISVIDDIARIILNRNKNKLHPETLKQMLADRGVIAGDAERCIWNMAVDECSLYDENVVLKPVRWNQSETVNKISGFFSSFF